MKDINLQTTLPALSFDYDKLMAWAKGIAAQYENLVVREEDIAGIKSEMAGLNNAKKAVDDVRKEAVKRVSAPIRQFEDQIKEVCAVFSETYDFLKEQVQAHEDRAREDKRVQVQFMVDNLKDEHGVPDISIDVDPSWLNKSKALKDVKAAIEGIILAHIKAEREAAQLEQAKKDRAVAIEQGCAALGAEFGVAISASEFLALNSLDMPLAEVNERMRQAFEKKAAIAPSPLVQPARQPMPAAPARASKGVAPGKKVMVVTLEYPADKEKIILSTLAGFDSMGINVTREKDAA